MTRQPNIYNVHFNANFIDIFSKFILEKNLNSKDILVLPTQRVCRKIERKLCEFSKADVINLPNSITFSGLNNNWHLFLNSCPNLHLENKILPTNLELLFKINELLNFKLEDFYHSEELLKFTNKIFTFADSSKITHIKNDCKNESISKMFDHFEKTINLPSQISRFVCEEIAKKFSNSDQKIIIVLPTESVPYIDFFIKELTKFDNVSLILNGFDKQKFDINNNSHPQFRINRFLKSLNVQPNTIKNLDSAECNKFVDVLMSTDFRKINQLENSITSNINLIECENYLQEIQVNALLIREHLDLGFERIGVISEDGNFNKVLKEYLSNWGIITNDTNTSTLENTIIGGAVNALIEAINEPTALNLLEAFKHKSSKFADLKWHEIENKHFRKINAAITPEIFENEELQQVCYKILNFSKGKETVKTKFKNFTKILNSIIDEGQTVQLKKIEEQLNSFSEAFINNQDFFFYLNKVLREIGVEDENFAYNDKVTITSILEARNMDFDFVLIPKLNHPYPSFSEMKKFLPDEILRQFNIPAEDDLMGFFHYDIASHLHKKCYLTRSTKVDGIDQIPALLFEKVDVLCKLINHNFDSSKYFLWLEKLHNIPKQNILPPLPRPKKFTKKISVSGAERLLENPYGFYASNILQLRKADPISPALEAKDFGNFLHNAIAKTTYFKAESKEIYLKKFINNFLLEVKNLCELPQIAEYWLPKIEIIASWIWEYEDKNIDKLNKILKEKGFQKTIEDVEVYAKCDRVELMHDGTTRIIDYKTGEPPSLKDIKSGKFPQLPIEAILMRQNGNQNFEFQYQCLKGGRIDAKIIAIKLDLDQAYEGLKILLNEFFNSEAEFFAIGDESKLRKTADYIHLSRLREWLN